MAEPSCQIDFEGTLSPLSCHVVIREFLSKIRLHDLTLSKRPISVYWFTGTGNWKLATIVLCIGSFRICKSNFQLWSLILSKHLVSLLLLLGDLFQIIFWVNDLYVHIYFYSLKIFFRMMVNISICILTNHFVFHGYSILSCFICQRFSRFCFLSCMIDSSVLDLRH